MNIEKILDKRNARLNPYPIEYQDLWDFLNKQRACVWFVEEIDLSKDNFEKLSENEKTFIKMILAFFSQFDGIVNLNITEHLLEKIQIIEAQHNYRWQMAMEDIHSDMYGLLIESYIKDDEEKNKLRNAINNFHVLNELKLWGEKWLSKNNFAISLLVNMFIEGIFFSAPFCLIFYISQDNKLPGLCKSNEFISRDEGMHTDFAVMIYNKLENKLKKEEVIEILNEMLIINEKFILQTLPCKLIGMSSTKMIQYVKFISDRLLFKMGYSKIFNINENPILFMDRIGLEGKNNFFESRTTEYQKSNNLKKKLDILENF